MRYPQAFLFIDSKQPLPSLANIQRWSGGRATYVSGESPINKALERRIRVISRLKQYLNPLVWNSGGVIVLNGTAVGSFLALALGGSLKHILWVDSQEHFRRLCCLERLTGIEEDCERYLRVGLLKYEMVQRWLQRETDYGYLADELFEAPLRAFRSRDNMPNIAPISSVMAGLRRHIKAQTRLGIVNRIDLAGEERIAA